MDTIATVILFFVAVIFAIRMLYSWSKGDYVSAYVAGVCSAVLLLLCVAEAWAAYMTAVMR
jgi:hypothetical protein